MLVTNIAPYFSFCNFSAVFLHFFRHLIAHRARIVTIGLHYQTPISDRMLGVSIAVSIPLTVRPSEAHAP